MLRGKGIRSSVGRTHHYLDMLGDTVGVKELPGKGDNRLATPLHLKAGLRSHDGNLGRLEVLLGGKFHRLRGIPGSHHHGHALLGLGYRKLGPVKPIVFLRNRIQVNLQARSQFANGHGDAARAKVVATLHKTREFTAAEESLDVALGQGIALLHLSAASLQRLVAVSLG